MKKNTHSITAAMATPEGSESPCSITAALVEKDGVKVGIVELLGFIDSGSDTKANAMAFTDKLATLVEQGAKEITLRVNSPGGDLFTALAMCDALADVREKGVYVQAVVFGVAASAATVVLMAADNVAMTNSSQLMVHEPSCCYYGKVSELQADVAELEKAWQDMVRRYTARTGQDPEEFAKAHTHDVWYTAEEAIAAGLADKQVTPLEYSDPTPEQQPEEVRKSVLATLGNAARRAASLLGMRSEPTEAEQLATAQARIAELEAQLAGAKNLLEERASERAEALAAAQAARAEAEAEVERKVAARVASFGLPSEVELPAPADVALAPVATKTPAPQLEQDDTVLGWLRGKNTAKVMLYAACSADHCQQVTRLLGQ